jgi:hypothetical protein
MTIPKFVRAEHRILPHHVVIELTTNADAFTDIPIWAEIALHNRANGAWICTYLGFVDHHQFAEWCKDYDVRFQSWITSAINQINARLFAAPTFDDAMKVLLRAGAIRRDGAVQRIAIPRLMRHTLN